MKEHCLEQAIDKLNQYIRRKGMRYTRSREKVMCAILELSDHFTVKDIVRKLREQGMKASQVTVYRTLPHLLDAGLIRQVERLTTAEEQVYENVLGCRHHDHLVCESCGKVIEFEDDEIEKLQNKVAEQYGFRLRRHYLDLVGVCKDCQQKIIDDAVGA